MKTAMSRSRHSQDELFHALDQLRAAHERSVGQRLQLLPLNLAIRQLTNAVADGSLRPVGAVRDQAARSSAAAHISAS